MEPTLFIYADESCLGNQFTDRDSPGGAAGLIEYWREGAWVRRDYWISEPGTTNNRMAIRSAIEGLRALRKPCGVVFCSDSAYLVKGMSEWIHGWRRNGWKRKTGALENAELWQELAAAAAVHRVEWRWIRGHAGHAQNEYANHLAIRAAKQQDASAALLPSGFEAWLEQQRGRGAYLDFHEFAPPAQQHPPAPGRRR
jgi:ribonuclease HI